MNDTKVKIVDIDMPFWSMVNFIFKWTFASIVATIGVVLVLTIPYFLVWVWIVSQ